MRPIRAALPLAGLLLCAAPALAANTSNTSKTPPATTGTATTPSQSQTGGSTSTPSTGNASGAAGMAHQTTTTGYPTQTAAEQACGGADKVVWGNSSSKAYHVAGDKYFGHTKHGSYMCLPDAQAKGYHLAGQSAAKHP